VAHNGVFQEIARVTTAALIVAAGRGSRAAASGATPKQYVELGGMTVLRRTALAFIGHPSISSVSVVIHAGDQELYHASMAGLGVKLSMPILGGATRQDSVRLGLEALAEAGHQNVLIHDAARPFVSHEVITAVLDALARAPGAIAAVPVADTLKEETAGKFIARTVSRDRLWRAQTPQGFHFRAIFDAHQRAHAEGAAGMTDDAAVAEWAGMQVAIAEGSERNRKLTTAEDLDMAERVLAADTPRETRTATGFDVHRFADGDHVWLGGVKIPHTQRLDGHSDADVVLHALTDALLGTIGDGDIGQHFPPSDPKWKGAASHLFLEDAARRVALRGGRIINVDVTILAEAPKVGPHREGMQAAIGKALGLAPNRIGIKATTMEGLGAIGRSEGIAAMASATVTLPASDQA
jgi:2-C-methyl-D-erythritol 4-phosphate cytidylyltransferase / 2-C-methyl-D-erythritol 2,4-cyclodiphosphate synthase